MAFNIKKWLQEDMGFTEAEATEMAPKFTADRITKIETTLGDVETRATAVKAIEKTQADLATANERLNAEMAEWASLTAKEKTEATELRASLEAARVRATQLETRLTTLATQHGVDPKPLLEGTAVVPDKKEPVVAPVADDRFDSFGRALSFNLDLPANLQYIQDEHVALTGTRLDTREIVKEIKANAGKKDGIIDPIAIWEAKYGIPEKRVAKAKKDHDAEIAAAESRGEERARTNAALPGPQAPGRHAPVFGARGDNGQITPRTSHLSRPQPQQGVRAAAAALASGKYRTKPATV